MFLFIVFLSFSFILIKSWVELFKDTKRINLPGPTPLPLIGNGTLFIGDSTKMLKTLKQLRDDYHGAYRIHLASSIYVVFSHPRYVEEVVSSSDLITKGKSYSFLRSWLGLGLLTSTGNRWKRHRKFLTPAFHLNILQNFLPVFCKIEKVLSEKLIKLVDGKSGLSIDLFPLIASAALDNITESIMGVSFHAQNNSESKYVKAAENFTEIVSTRIRNPFMSCDAIFNMLPIRTRQDKILKILHGETKKVIEARMQELKNAKKTILPSDSQFGIKNKHAFLDLLLLGTIDGEKIDDESIREQVDTFMFEGHDTITSAISFCLYCLSIYEEIQEKVLNEQISIFGSDLKRDPTFSELNQMRYLKLVIKESLRLYPSVPIFERMITEDTVVAGIHLPKNTTVVIDVFNMQRSDDVFEDPLTFNPERFDSSIIRNPFSWIPFSAGPRNCIGQKFAMMEMKVTISALVKKFKILPSHRELELSGDLILRSRNGVHIKLKPRD